jgi:lysylphosphatidylglycerol synthetase-like protein (DUF2156 family)
MPTTTKMGIVYPSSTDLVKDGATNMGTIATTVDAKTGLVLLNSTTFSAVSSQAAPNNTFTSAFRNYRILLSNLTSSVNGTELRLRLRTSGTDTTTSSYYRYAFAATSGSLINSYALEASWFMSALDFTATVPSAVSIDLFNPQVATRTQIHYQMFSANTNLFLGASGFQVDTGSQFDSINIFPASGTISGQMQIFGYNQ